VFAKLAVDDNRLIVSELEAILLSRCRCSGLIVENNTPKFIDKKIPLFSDFGQRAHILRNVRFESRLCKNALTAALALNGFRRGDQARIAWISGPTPRIWIILLRL
jgi:hypothetical protein